MKVRFGNLTVKAFIEKTDADFTDDEIEKLESMRSDRAQDTPSGKFHIFADPSIGFVVSKEISKEVVGILKAANTRKVFNKQVYVEEF